MKLKALLVALFALVALVPAVPADAGAHFTSPTSCPLLAGYEQRVCIDISLNKIYVYATIGNGWSFPTYTFSGDGYLSISQANPQPGSNVLPWRAEDSECNASGPNTTTFPISATGDTVTISSNGIPWPAHQWNWYPTSITARDIVAYMVNLNGSGGNQPVECFIVA